MHCTVAGNGIIGWYYCLFLLLLGAVAAGQILPIRPLTPPSIPSRPWGDDQSAPPCPMPLSSKSIGLQNDGHLCLAGRQQEEARRASLAILYRLHLAWWLEPVACPRTHIPCMDQALVCCFRGPKITKWDSWSNPPSKNTPKCVQFQDPVP